MKKAVFLDRDGVLNETIFRDGKPRAPYTLEDFRLFAGVPEALKALHENDWVLIVVTNQPDVARGWVSEEAVHLVNQKLRELVFVDDIKICFHTEKDNCNCRKPRPGMLLSAAAEKNIDLTKSWMIGDRFSDIEAGKAAGCHTILVGNGDSAPGPAPELQVKSLLEATIEILKSV